MTINNNEKNVNNGGFSSSSMKRLTYWLPPTGLLMVKVPIGWAIRFNRYRLFSLFLCCWPTNKVLTENEFINAYAQLFEEGRKKKRQVRFHTVSWWISPDLLKGVVINTDEGLLRERGSPSSRPLQQVTHRWCDCVSSSFFFLSLVWFFFL